ncbi:MAG: chromate transporter, partial [Bacilli bacterium]
LLFTDILAISQMTPGPIGINVATFIGFNLGGPLGALIATIGFILPSFIILTILSYIYNKYKNLEIIQAILKALRPTIVAMIFSAGFTVTLIVIFKDDKLALSSISFKNVILLVASFIAIRKYHFPPIRTMFISGFINVIIYFIL